VIFAVRQTYGNVIRASGANKFVRIVYLERFKSYSSVSDVWSNYPSPSTVAGLHSPNSVASQRVNEWQQNLDGIFVQTRNSKILKIQWGLKL